ncbi:hypothetical protein [Nannocystis punicea]|uniref:Uncharacterized protein n=1 Tax=Nannocystis punicea TaxID=2995304 RepID=A0ABY7H8D7_9BACT|nr:hypothetical protein [Nannocystis poenicansa]WAS95531.1 hypothetical protein O0S08_05160 [Nannocystis poenicansa]
MSGRSACLLALAWLGGCGEPNDLGGGESDAATASSTIEVSSTSSGSVDEPTASTTSGGDGESGSVFIAPPDAGGPGRCDPWMQDCPEGQKCNAWSGDGDNWPESHKCVDVVPEPDGLYEPCEVFGSAVSGEDSCEVGMICWGVVDGVGRCIGFCTGSPEAPDCADPLASCVITGDGVVTLCQPVCHPLLQDCAPDDVCIPNPVAPDEFTCVLDASGDEGQVFDPCEYTNACDPGLYCLAPELADECDPRVVGCCAPFCDTSLANACPGQGQECVPWSEPGTALPGFEHVGVCEVPQ